MAKTRAHRRNNRRFTQRKRGGGKLGKLFSCFGASCIKNTTVNNAAHTVTEPTTPPIGQAPTIVGNTNRSVYSIDPVDSILLNARHIIDKYKSARKKKSRGNTYGARQNVKNTFNARRNLINKISETVFEPKYTPIIDRMIKELNKKLFNIDRFNIIINALSDVKKETDENKIEFIHTMMNHKLINYILSQPLGTGTSVGNHNIAEVNVSLQPAGVGIMPGTISEFNANQVPEQKTNSAAGVGIMPGTISEFNANQVPQQKTNSAAGVGIMSENNSNMKELQEIEKWLALSQKAKKSGGRRKTRR